MYIATQALWSLVLAFVRIRINDSLNGMVVHVKWFPATIKYFLCMSLCATEQPILDWKASEVLKTLANIWLCLFQRSRKKNTTTSKHAGERKMENWKTRTMHSQKASVIYLQSNIYPMDAELVYPIRPISWPCSAIEILRLISYFLTMAWNRSNTYNRSSVTPFPHRLHGTPTHTLLVRTNHYSNHYIESVGKADGSGGDGGGGDCGVVNVVQQLCYINRNRKTISCMHHQQKGNDPKNIQSQNALYSFSGENGRLKEAKIIVCVWVWVWTWDGMLEIYKIVKVKWRTWIVKWIGFG